MSKSKLLAGLSAVAALAVVATTVQAQQDAIAKRKEFMKSVGAASKLSNEMIKGEKPFDGKTVAEGLTKVAAGWDAYSKLYPKGTETGGETTASPKIWENFKDFDEKGQALAKAATNVAAEAGKGLDAFKAAWPQVGGTCKGCHEVYRVQKK